MPVKKTCYILPLNAVYPKHAFFPFYYLLKGSFNNCNFGSLNMSLLFIKTLLLSPFIIFYHVLSYAIVAYIGYKRRYCLIPPAHQPWLILVTIHYIKWFMHYTKNRKQIKQPDHRKPLEIKKPTANWVISEKWLSL